MFQSMVLDLFSRLFISKLFISDLEYIAPKNQVRFSNAYILFSSFLYLFCLSLVSLSIFFKYTPVILYYIFLGLLIISLCFLMYTTRFIILYDDYFEYYYIFKYHVTINYTDIKYTKRNKNTLTFYTYKNKKIFLDRSMKGIQNLIDNINKYQTKVFKN